MRKKSQQHQDPFAAREASKYDNPIPSREFILQLMEQAPGPLTFEQLARALDLGDETQLEALRRRVRAMERDGQLITNRRGELGATGKMDLLRGRVQGHREGFGFVIPADGSPDLYLSNRQMRKVFDGDEVLVRPGPEDFRGRREASIVEVLTRHTHQLVGRLFSQAGSYFVRPDNPRHTHDVIIPANETQGARDGQFVVVEITQHPERYQKVMGRVMEVLGDHMAPGMEIDVAIRSHGIPHTWPGDVQREAANFSEEVKEKDKKNRVDLRKLPLVTIDGEDARDFDDAVYCEKTAKGWRLLVAIADVSHYVAPGSALDQEALVRGNSVYFPDFVVPMLPHVLSNGLCSLNPGVDRLCMVCEMTVSGDGKVSAFKFYEGLMHSHARLTYTKVGAMLDNNHAEHKSLRKEYAAVVPHIETLHEVYQTLRAEREARGAIDFESNETRIIFDSERKIEKIVPVQRNEAHKLIEECMLAANVCAAKLLEEMAVPCLYRVHEAPSAEKLELLQEFLVGVGLAMRAKAKVTPQMYKDVLAQVQGRADAHVIQTVMLRSMNQARYQPDNHGHFGLAYTAYAHFTSPIRRYPDLVVHRAIRALIRSDLKSAKLQRLKSTAQCPFAESYPYGAADMLNFGEQCSLTERRADDATRDVISWLKCEYLRERVGEDFNGVISAVTAFGLFIELDELFVEGLIHITALPQDYYHHEVAHHCLVGERSGRKFRLGDSLRVRVARVDLDERKIDFEFIKAVGARSVVTGAEPQKHAGTSRGERRVRKRSPLQGDAVPQVVEAAADSKAVKGKSKKAKLAAAHPETVESKAARAKTPKAKPTKSKTDKNNTAARRSAGKTQATTSSVAAQSDESRAKKHRTKTGAKPAKDVSAAPGSAKVTSKALKDSGKKAKVKAAEVKSAEPKQKSAKTKIEKSPKVQLKKSQALPGKQRETAEKSKLNPGKSKAKAEKPKQQGQVSKSSAKKRPTSTSQSTGVKARKSEPKSAAGKTQKAKSPKGVAAKGKS